MALKTTHPDGRQTHWWRNKEAKDYCGKYPSVTSASGSVEDIQAAIAELEAIKQGIQKHLASTKRHRYTLDAEVQSDHLPKGISCVAWPACCSVTAMPRCRTSAASS